MTTRPRLLALVGYTVTIPEEHIGASRSSLGPFTMHDLRYIANEHDDRTVNRHISSKRQDHTALRLRVIPNVYDR